MSKLEVGFQRTAEAIKFDVPVMADMLEKAYLANEREQKAFKRKTFPPSGVGYQSGTCARRWYYAFEGKVAPVNDVDVLGRANMQYGTEAGERIAKLFEEADLLVKAEKLAHIKNPPIKGYIDLIINWQGELAIGEVKTTKQEAFTLLKASGKPRGYQLIQLLIYMKIEKVDRGFMLYENKNTGEFLIMPVFMTDENKRITDDAFEWFETVYNNEELPTRPEGVSKSKQPCMYCPFKAHCWETKEDKGTITIRELEVPES